MFGKPTTPGKTSTIDSLIGVGSTIEGDLKFRGGLRIDGHVRGSLLPAEEGMACTVMISENGRVDGAVKASHVIVNGLINGPVEATEHLDLQPKAKVTGDIRYKAIEIHHGAVVEGALSHLDSTKPALKLAASNFAAFGEN
jgi:cytoskeletal protein CcmA (bactofilin family)